MTRRQELEKIIARAQRSLERSSNYAMNLIDKSIIRRAREELKELDESGS